MVVRFDNKLLQDTVARRVEPIGVEGDPASQKGGLTEAEAILKSVSGQMPSGGQADEKEMKRISHEIISEQEHGQQEPGPELDANVLEKARQKAASGKESVGMGYK